MPARKPSGGSRHSPQPAAPAASESSQSCHTPTVALEQIALLPPQRLCREAWPLLSFEQRARTTTKSATSVVTQRLRPMLPLSVGSGTDMGEASLSEMINCAADEYLAIPDPVGTLVPLRSALYGYSYQQAFATAVANVSMPIAVTSEGGASATPPLAAKRQRSERGGITGGIATASGHARRGGGGIATRNTTAGRSRTTANSNTLATATLHPATAATTISDLLTCPTSKKDEMELKRQLLNMLTKSPMRSFEEALPIVNAELDALVQQCVASPGPKFQTMATSVVHVFTQCCFLVHRPQANEELARSAGFAAVALLHMIQCRFQACPEDCRASTELFVSRVLTPIFHLIPVVPWMTEHYYVLAAELRGMQLPSAEDHEAATTTGDHNVVAGAVEDPAIPFGFEEIVFDEQIQLDNKCEGTSATSLRRSSSPPPPPAVHFDPSEVPSGEHRWTSTVSLPYADKVSVMIHKAVRCENLRLCLISADAQVQGLAQHHQKELHPTSTRCITQVSPRSAHVMHHGGTVFVVCNNTSTFSHFQASVVATVKLQLDTRWHTEMRVAFSRALLAIAESLLDTDSVFAVTKLQASEGLLSALGGGMKAERCESEELPPSAPQMVLDEPDTSIARRCRCRLSDVPKLRPCLAIAAFLISTGELACGNLECEAWKEVSRKATLFLERLDAPGGETTAKGLDVARTLIEHAVPPMEGAKYSATRALEVATNIITSPLTSSNALVEALRQRSALADQWIAGLNLLTTAASLVTLSEMHHVASACRTWMGKGVHYLQRVTGCGAAKEQLIRQAIHRLLSFLFQSLTVAIRRLASASTRAKPHRYVTGDAEHGALMLLTVSLLTAPLDSKDLLHIAQSRIAEQLLELLPNFSDFARSNSFQVSDEAESGMTSLLQSLMDQWSFAEGGASGTNGTSVNRSSSPSRSRQSLPSLSGGTASPGLVARVNVVPCIGSSNSLPNAQKAHSTFSGDVYNITGNRLKWQVAKEPILDILHAEEDGRMLHGGLPPYVEVNLRHLTKDALKAFTIAFVSSELAMEGLPQLQQTLPRAEETKNSIFFSLETSTLTTSDANGAVTTTPWIPLESGDIVGFGFVFNSPQQIWRLHMFVNGLDVCAIPIAHHSVMYFGIGAADRGLSLKGPSSVDVSFQPGSDKSMALWYRTCVQSLGRGPLPTLHEVALHASHAFHVLMSRCAKVAASSSHIRSASRIGSPTSPLSAGSASRDFAFGALLDRGGELLCANYEAVVQLLEALPTTAPTAASRVKLTAAHHVYNTVIMYLLGTIRVLSKVTRLTAETFHALCRSVQCLSIHSSTRILALSQIVFFLEDAQQTLFQVPQPPMELWECCAKQGQCTMANEYVPMFVSVGPLLTVEEGGRSVASSSQKFGGNMRNAAMASPPISLLASGVAGSTPSTNSLPDICSFSVRMQRQGRNTGSLGRYYFVGVVGGNKPADGSGIFTDYTKNMSDKFFFLPDFASEAPGHLNKVEFERYKRYWMTSEGSGGEQVVYGCGDLITVTVDRKKRNVSFSRNGCFIGTLFSNIPEDITELHPTVCLYNGDASATFHFRNSELAIRSRALLRQMLRVWQDQLVPVLFQWLDDRNPMALMTLQSDGNEFAFIQRNFQQHSNSSSTSSSSTASGSIPRRSQCTMLRIQNDHMEVIDGEGRHRWVHLDSLVQDFNAYNERAVVLDDAHRRVILAKLVEMVSSSIMDDGEGSVCVLAPRIVIRALRLVCQTEFSALQCLPREAIETLLSTLQLLASSCGSGDAQRVSTASSGSSNGMRNKYGTIIETTVQSAWSEIDVLDEDQAVFQRGASSPTSSPNSPEPHAQPSSSLNRALNSDRVGSLACWVCGEAWGLCAHEAPITEVQLLQGLLQRAGDHSVTSPNKNMWEGEWNNGDVRVTLSPAPEEESKQRSAIVGRADVEGTGEDARGRFKFVGVVIDGYRISGKVTYMHYDKAEDSLANSGNKEAEDTWTCEACTLINPIAVTRCGVCGSGRQGSCWTCQGCTYAYNSVDMIQCMMCGTRRLEQDRPSSAGEESTVQKARCVDCRGSRTFTSFGSFKRLFECTACRRQTTWLPEEVFTATLHASLTAAGDAMDAVVQVGREFSWLYLQSSAFTVALLKEALRCTSPELYQLYQQTLRPIPSVSLKSMIDAQTRSSQAITNSSSGSGSASASATWARAGLEALLGQGLGGDHEAALRVLGLVVAPPTVRDPNGSPSSPNSNSNGGMLPVDASHTSVRLAAQLFASRALCSWIPDLVSNNYISMDTASEYFLSLQYSCDSWLDHWGRIDATAALKLLDVAISALLNRNVPPQVAAALTNPCIRLLQTLSKNPEVPQRKSLLVAGLSAMSSVSQRDAREASLQALVSVLEWIADDEVNCTPVRRLLTQQPSLLAQQRLALFVAQHGVESGRRTSAVTAAAWVSHAVRQMLRVKPLASYFDVFSPDFAPHLVVLPDTRLNENGDLMVGQTRGSVAVHPNRGGKWYYEMVLPPNFADRLKVCVMGWGSKLHEVQGSSQHVGSDFHSWGFNGRNRVRLLTGEHEIPVTKAPGGGDVVGALLDLDAKQMCWSINGEQLQWLDIPLQGDGEPIYPYVSASVEPHCVIVRLSETQYLPEGYCDFRNRMNELSLRTPSTITPPQSYTFYQQVTLMVNELCAGGLSVEAIVGASSDYSARVRGLLLQFHEVRRVLMDGMAEDDPVTMETIQAKLLPYVKHLMCLSSMAAVVAKRTELLRDSPYLWRHYTLAKELLFFSARWALVDVHLSRRLNRSGERRILQIVIDRFAAEVINTARASQLEQHPQNPTTTSDTTEVLMNTVTGQMFHALKGKDVYTLLTMFTVQFRDSITEDAGGVTRSVISMMCDELMWQYKTSAAPEDMANTNNNGVTAAAPPAATTTTTTSAKRDPTMPLFVLTNHSVYFNIVPNMPWLSSLSMELETVVLTMYEWLGKLFGNAVLAGTIVYSVSFPRLVWKYLIKEECTFEEYLLDCNDSVRGAIEDPEFLMNDEQYFSAIPGVKNYFAMQPHPELVGGDGSAGSQEDEEQQQQQQRWKNVNNFHDALSAEVEQPATTSEMLSAELAERESQFGSAVDLSVASDPLTSKRIEQRRSAAIQALLHQYDRALERMRTGFESVVPAAAIEQMRWDDLRQRVCGSDAASAADILANLDMTLLSEEMQQLLSTAIHTMSSVTRGKFLLFATGQRRLPVPEKIRVTCGSEPTELPTAHTCSPISLMLQPYKTTEELLEKLHVSLSHVYEFGFV